MRIISFIEDQQIVKKILQHLDLWHVKRKPPPRSNDPPSEAIIIYDQSSSPGVDDYLIDADYPIEAYIGKNPAAGKAVSYARKYLYAKLHVEKQCGQ